MTSNLDYRVRLQGMSYHLLTLLRAIVSVLFCVLIESVVLQNTQPEYLPNEISIAWPLLLFFHDGN
jgi:hypothetical protein